jgi:hypothetical protein
VIFIDRLNIVLKRPDSVAGEFRACHCGEFYRQAALKIVEPGARRSRRLEPRTNIRTSQSGG